MPATAAVHDSTITAEGYELLHSELDALRTDGRREMRSGSAKRARGEHR